MQKKEAREDIRELSVLERERKRMSLLQDIGILIFLFSMFAAVLAILWEPEDTILEGYVMFAFMAAAVVMAAYHMRYTAAAVVGLQVLIYAMYHIYQSAANQIEIVPSTYMWVFLPLVSVGSMLLFQSVNYRMTISNEVFSKQMETVVLLDSLTGLYNVKALYIDLERAMAYSRRNGLAVSLLWIRLRYDHELKLMLSDRQFEELLQRLASYIEGSLRVEDRIYCVDDSGIFAAILTCDIDGAQIVKNRIRQGLKNENLFSGILDRTIKVELQMASLQYDQEVIRDALMFRKRTESEMQYDV